MKSADRYLYPIFALVALGITVVFFGPYLNNFFAFDDFAILEHIVQGPKAVLLGYNYILRFVANGVTWPLFLLSGYDPFGYNLFSALLWLLNGFLFFRFIDRLFADRWLAFLAGTIFVGSAIGIDAAFWRAANSTLLNLSFYLLTLHAYVVYRQTGNRRQWWLSLFYFGLAVFSKEESGSLPLVIIMLEAFFLGGAADRRGVIKRVLAFVAVVAGYVALNYIVIYLVIGAQAEVARYSHFRPLRSLFTGWTAFFLSPDSRLAANDFRIYLTCLLVPLSFLLVKERRLLLFGYGWVFVTFLPQSLSTLTQLEPRFLCNSLSRHLYLPSAGVAIVYACLLVRIRDRFSHRAALVSGALFLVLFLSYNYLEARARGLSWLEEGEPMRTFMTALRKEVPQFPPNTYLFVNNAPTGRAFMQQGLRGFYRNPAITWINDPNTFHPKPGDTALLINCIWRSERSVRLEFFPWR